MSGPSSNDGRPGVVHGANEDALLGMTPGEHITDDPVPPADETDQSARSGERPDAATRTQGPGGGTPPPGHA